MLKTANICLNQARIVVINRFIYCENFASFDPIKLTCSVGTLGLD